MSTSSTTTAAATCPYQPGTDERKSAGSETARLSRAKFLSDNNGIKVDRFGFARKVLRSDGTRQAGFMASLVARASAKGSTPVLYQEGEVHQKQRAATARFFAPRIVTTRYRDLMTNLSDQLMANLRATGRADLSDLSLDMAVAVAAEVIGLTDSPLDAMSARLNSFFTRGNARPVSKFTKILRVVRSQMNMLGFYWLDVKPAIRARKRTLKEDVISHLVQQGYSNREILTECLTYGAAGMVTTREFIVMAAWHLMERPALQAEFVATDEAGRLAILEEVLRLEPVVGDLYRRATEDLTFEHNGETLKIAEGTLIDIDIRAANADPEAVGECPYQLVPNREVGERKAAMGSMSFGDGSHRCPGAAVALQESAIFLESLFKIPGLRMEGPPSLAWNTLTVGYELRSAMITIN